MKIYLKKRSEIISFQIHNHPTVHRMVPHNKEDSSTRVNRAEAGKCYKKVKGTKMDLCINKILNKNSFNAKILSIFRNLWCWLEISRGAEAIEK